MLNGGVGFSVFFQYTARKFKANHEGLELNVLHQVLVYDGEDVNLGEINISRIHKFCLQRGKDVDLK